MILVPFEAHHAALIRPQGAQACEASLDGVPPGESWTAVQDGVPLACFGVVPLWNGRGYCWALLDQDCGPYMLHLTRAIRSLIVRADWRRIEMAVDSGFAAGCRWAEMLGFQRENDKPARKFFPDGRDAWLYARV